MRSLASDDSCSHLEEADGGACYIYDDMRSMGADVGYEWDLWMLHLSPRLGMGSVRPVHFETRELYLEPGAVLDVQVGPFMAGLDIRYRIVVDDSNWNGPLATARLGLRF